MYLEHIRRPKKRGLAKTGQVVSFQDYDDAYYKIGIPKSGERFVDNGDGTITDRATRLMWVKDPSQIPGGLWGSPGSPSVTTWSNAIINCEALDYAGYNDWRLPNIRELESLTDYSIYGPAIDTFYFPNTRTGYYWSSSTRMNLTSYAWIVYAYYGYTYYSNKGNSYYTRPVRRGM